MQINTKCRVITIVIDHFFLCSLFQSPESQPFERFSGRTLGSFTLPQRHPMFANQHTVRIHTFWGQFFNVADLSDVNHQFYTFKHDVEANTNFKI